MSYATLQSIQYVNASLQFAAATNEVPQSFVECLVPIHNARLEDSELSLHRDGFMLAAHKTAVRDFYDSSEVTNIYYSEIASLVRNITNATFVTVFTHAIRRAAKEGRGDPAIQQPFKLVHNDYTAKTGPIRVREVLGSQAHHYMQYPFSIFNIWRPLHGPLQESPLAVCNATSVTARHVVPILSKDPGGKQIIVYSLTFNPEQRWSYFPMMHPDEVLIFKTFDSRDDGRARFTFHSAFDDPNTPANARPRESVEVRVIGFFI